MLYSSLKRVAPLAAAAAFASSIQAVSALPCDAESEALCPGKGDDLVQLGSCLQENISDASVTPGCKAWLDMHTACKDDLDKNCEFMGYG